MLYCVWWCSCFDGGRGSPLSHPFTPRTSCPLFYSSLPSLLLLLFTFSKPERARLPVSVPPPPPMSSGLLDLKEKVGAEVSVVLAAGALTRRGLRGLYTDGNHVGGGGEVAVGPARHLPLWHDVVDGCEEEEGPQGSEEVQRNLSNKRHTKVQLKAADFWPSSSGPSRTWDVQTLMVFTSGPQKLSWGSGRMPAGLKVSQIGRDGRLKRPQKSQSGRYGLPGGAEVRVIALFMLPLCVCVFGASTTL